MGKDRTNVIERIDRCGSIDHADRRVLWITAALSITVEERRFSAALAAEKE